MITRIDSTSRDATRSAIVLRDDSGEGLPWTVLLSGTDDNLALVEDTTHVVATLQQAQQIARRWVDGGLRR